MLKRKTEPLEDLINQGLIANQKIPLPKKSNENVTGSFLEYPEENIEYGSNINYPNPYSEGESFTPDNVSLGQQNIRKNIPLGLGIAQPTSMPRSMSMSIPSIEEPQQEDSTNFLGSLLSQGAAMLGAGVRGGDVGQVGRMFDLNRQEAFRQGQYQKQKAEQKQKIKEQENTAKQYVDPNSEISIQERAKAEELYPFPIPKNLSYADINNNKVMEALKAKYNATQEQKNLEEQKGLQSRLDDPNSPESIKLRNDLNLLRINVPKGLSANQMKEYYPRLLELSKPQPMIGGGGVRRGGVAQGKEKQQKRDEIDKEDVKKISAMEDLNNSIDNLITSVDTYGRAYVGEEAQNQDDLMYGIAASSGVIKGQGAMTESDIKFWQGVLSPSKTGSKEDYINRMKKKKNEYIKGITKSLELKGYTVKQNSDGKYQIFDKNENYIGQY
jgi:hypothetical protein